VLHRAGVMDLLRTQGWVARIDQLREAGVSSSAVSRARQQGLVDAIAPGLVGLHRAWLGFESRAWAACLLGGDGAFLSGQTAGRLHGLRGMAASPIEVSVPETMHRSVPSWIRLVKSSWVDGERRPGRSDGLVVASPLRTLFGLAGQLGRTRFGRAAEDAWHLGLVHPCDAAEYLTRIRRQGLTGVARFEAWLDHVAAQSAPAQSGLEQLLADIVQRSGLPDPERQFPLTLPRGGIVHLDLAWPAIRLALEPGHSWWHGGDLAMRADQERDRACGEVGWHVVRYDESVRQHRDSAARELVGIYRERARLVFASRSTPASAGERAILRTDRPGTTP
jgi:hypothetical protein